MTLQTGITLKKRKKYRSGLKKNSGGTNKGTTPKGTTPNIWSNEQGTFVAGAFSEKAGEFRIRRVDGNELDRLLLGKKLTPSHHAIGSEFVELLWRAQLIGSRGTNYNAPSSVGGERSISTRQAVAFRTAGQAIDYLKKKGGVHVKNLVLDVALDARSVNNRKELNQLVAGLEILARFFSEKIGAKLLLDPVV